MFIVLNFLKYRVFEVLVVFLVVVVGVCYWLGVDCLCVYLMVVLVCYVVYFVIWVVCVSVLRVVGVFLFGGDFLVFWSVV